MDKHKEIVEFRAVCHGQEGICNAIELLQLLRDYDDWYDYQTMKKVQDILGISGKQLDHALSEELKGTRIVINNRK